MPNANRPAKQQAGLRPGDMETQIGIIDQTAPHIKRNNDKARALAITIAGQRGYSDLEVDELLDQLGLISVE